MLRKDYLKKTVAPKDGIGMFLAERVCKKWNEDFVDEDTQEIVSIERNQILIPFFTDTFCEEHADAVLWCDGLFQVVFSEHNFFI